jgi:hypothetical protein
MPMVAGAGYNTDSPDSLDWEELELAAAGA